MLMNMNHVLRYAGEKQYYVGAFNMPNLGAPMVVIRTAGKHEEPVIIQHAQLHECEMPIHIIGPIVVCMAEEARVPACVMLDHGKDLDYVRKALDLGFPAVVYDDSSLACEENVAITREVVVMAKACNMGAETEVGTVTGRGGKTFAINDASDAYTDPELTARYVKDMDIDALTALVGTIYGFYATKPKLDLDRVVKIKELTGFPPVMHGGSGISVADIQRVIRCDICKTNYSSYMSNAGAKAVKKLLKGKEVKYFHGLANAAVDAIEQDVLNAMSMFVLGQV